MPSLSSQSVLAIAVSLASNSKASSPIPVFDTHFHLWDTISNESGHDATVAGYTPKFTAADYQKEMAALPAELVLEGGAWMEAMSVCYAGISGLEFSQHCSEELNYADGQLRGPFSGGELSEAFLLLPSAGLEQDDAQEVLANMASNSRVRGIRQIMNYEPSFPRNAVLGELLDDKRWQRGLEALGKHGLAFDLQLNPSQYLKAARVLKSFPQIPIIINHLGTPSLEDLTNSTRARKFWEGMEQLARLPQTFMKISYLAAIDEKWDENPLVLDAVHKVVHLFGPQRCFFTSNFPVERASGWDIGRLYAAFLKIAESYSDEAQRAMFAGSAKKAYGYSAIESKVPMTV